MIQKAKISQVEQIYKLISEFAKQRLLLPRPRVDIYEHIRDFFVFLDDSASGAGFVIGCCALHIVWEDLAEVRSLAVSKSKHGNGIGSDLVKACLLEAQQLGIKKVFALTYAPKFFQTLGFELIEKHLLPRKIWKDCVNCPYFPDCEEQAVIIEL